MKPDKREYYICTLDEFFDYYDDIKDLKRLYREDMVNISYNLGDKKEVINEFGGYPCRMRKAELVDKIINYYYKHIVIGTDK